MRTANRFTTTNSREIAVYGAISRKDLAAFLEGVPENARVSFRTDRGGGTPTDPGGTTFIRVSWQQVR